MRNCDTIKNVEFLVSERSNLNGVWDLITKYCVPFRNEFFKQGVVENAVDWRENRDVFDSTAVGATQDLASFIHGSITSQTTIWFGFKFKQPALNADQECREWLETCADISYTALQESNFNVEANETYVDLVSYAISYMVEEPMENADGSLDELYFETIPVDEGYFEQDHRGRAYRFYRKFEWYPSQIISKFGELNVPTQITMMDLDPVKSKQKIGVVMAIFPNPANKKNLNSPRKLAPELRPFTCRYVAAHGVDGMSQVEPLTIYETGHYEFPVFVPRWRKTSKSKFGNGPSHYALPDILTANQYVELVLKAGEKVIDPAILTTRRGLLGDLDLGPGGMTIVQSLDQIAPFESKARFDVSQLQIEDLRRSIRNAYFVDQLKLKDSPAMTASEANIRFELMQRLMGPTLGRLQEDFLSPLLQRTFNIMFRYGKFPTPPQMVIDSKAELDVEYTGPMARAQRSDSVMAIEHWVGNLAALSEVFPEVLDIPDPDKLASKLRELGGVPASLERSSSAIKIKRTNREKAQQAAQQAQLTAMQAEAQQASNVANQPQPMRSVGKA